MAAYYNEIDPYAAQWLRNLIAAGHIAPGDVDERSITDVHADDLKGYTQCHFFAGIGGWSLGARMAGWHDDRPLWTGSCPCQPFSVIGKHEGENDERHLWPTFFSLLSTRRPAVVMGEQVAAAVGKDWLDGVHSDLESIGYACGAAVVPACGVDAPHRRDRLWFVADAARDDKWRDGASIPSDRSQVQTGRLRPTNNVDDTLGARLERQRRDGADFGQSGWVKTDENRSASEASGAISRGNSTHWSGAEWRAGADGKARRVEPGIRLLAHGVPARVGKLRAYGNAIVPQVAAEVIGAYMETAA
jgi:DNA (cytosine-5)-methyltransferase 1